MNEGLKNPEKGLLFSGSEATVLPLDWFTSLGVIIMSNNALSTPLPVKVPNQDPRRWNWMKSSQQGKKKLQGCSSPEEKKRTRRGRGFPILCMVSGGSQRSPSHSPHELFQTPRCSGCWAEAGNKQADWCFAVKEFTAGKVRCIWEWTFQLCTYFWEVLQVFFSYILKLGLLLNLRLILLASFSSFFFLHFHFLLSLLLLLFCCY